MGPKPYKYYRTPPSSAAQAAAPNAAPRKLLRRMNLSKRSATF